MPHLTQDAHLLTFDADVWYRVAISQFILDYHQFPLWSLRYETYGHVPEWYPPLGPWGLAILSRTLHLDLPTICSRVIPFLEAAAPLPFFWVIHRLYTPFVAYLSTLFLILSPAFVYWTALATPQTLTVGLMPYYIFLWLRYVGLPRLPALRMKRYTLLGLLSFLLAMNFLFHLTYFLVLVILFLLSGIWILERRATLACLKDLGMVAMISNVLTMWWWLPRNLYPWWFFRLTTSPSLFGGRPFGMITALIGLAALTTLIALAWRSHRSRSWRQRRLLLIPLAWAAVPLLETRLEWWLALIHGRLLGSTIWKPFEGFRFYVFLIPPLALAVGLVGSTLWSWAKQAMARGVLTSVACVFAVALVSDYFFGFRLPERLRNARISPREYRAASWYRAHSAPHDRLVADYHRGQMVAGVAGGKVLLGFMFPLRNVEIPLINEPRRVSNEVCQMYLSHDPAEIAALMEHYQATHLFYSVGLATSGKFGTGLCDDQEGISVDLAAFTDPRYFELVYDDGQEVKILKRKAAGQSG